MTTPTTARFGMTVPFGGPLHAQRERFVELERQGYTDLWSAEVDGTDGVTPLAVAAGWVPSMRLGTAILPVFTRGPALLAQSFATLASVAPGRVVAGIGSSSDVIVERWNGVDFDRPFERTRDMVRFLRAAFSGEKVTEEYATFSVRGFRLNVAVEQPIPIVVAALRQGMLRMAGREADGAIVNWLSADDASRVSAIVQSAGGGAPKEIVARLFVCPSDRREEVVAGGRFAMAAYLNVPVYRAFHEWMGRGEALAEHWERWEAGDRKGSLDKIPETIVDDLIVNGTVEECRAHLDRYVANGITTPVLQILPFGGLDAEQAARDLSPRG